MTKHHNPMECPRVQQRVAELEKYLYLHHPNQLFDKLYVNRAGELGQSFVLRVNGINYQATLWRSSHQATAITPLFSNAETVNQHAFASLVNRTSAASAITLSSKVTKYAFTSGVWDGEPASYKTCQNCWEIHAQASRYVNLTASECK
jgi:hypothetical protein